MNRYRFYEIIQAHKNGEDLSKFTPKNKPEADLINALQGGGGDSAGSVKSLIKSRGNSASHLFEYMQNETNIDKYLSYDDTKDITHMDFMFSACSILGPSIRLNTSSCITLENTFSASRALEFIELNNTSKCSNFDFTFSSCEKLVSVSPLDTVSAFSMNYTFQNCWKLETIDITKLSSYNESFASDCYSLKKLIIRTMDTIPTYGECMLENCCHLLGKSHTDWFNNVYNPEGLKDGRIYVPDDKVEELKAAQGWSDFADVIVPLSTLEE